MRTTLRKTSESPRTAASLPNTRASEKGLRFCWLSPGTRALKSLDIVFLTHPDRSPIHSHLPSPTRCAESVRHTNALVLTQTLSQPQPVTLQHIPEYTLSNKKILSHSALIYSLGDLHSKPFCIKSSLMVIYETAHPLIWNDVLGMTN